MKNKILNVLFVLFFLVGVSLLAYPTFSNFVYKMYQSRAVAVYEDRIQELNTVDTSEQFERAADYNERLRDAESRQAFLVQNEEEYEELLNVSGSSMMGYIEIPSIKTTLPIYHGTDESVLEVAVGHVEWSSLPVGGEGTNTILSGHRGLPSARLFTDLDLVTEGSVFSLHILDRVLYYEVDDISVVLPEETDNLVPVEGEDYCTLVTCTPYGINSHRLLVRGKRIYPSAVTYEITGDVDMISREYVAIGIGVFVFVVSAILSIVSFIKRRKRRARRMMAKEAAKGVENEHV